MEIINANHKLFTMFCKDRIKILDEKMSKTQELKEFNKLSAQLSAYHECYQFYCALFGVK